MSSFVLKFYSGAQIPPGLYATLTTKMTSNILMRKVVLEGHRFGAKEAIAERIVDFVSPAEGETGGPAKTLATSTEFANKVALKAGADCYQSNKLVIYAFGLSILREK